MSQLQRLAEEIGFHNSYVNCFGHNVTPQDDALAALVSAMGYDISNDEVLRQQADLVAHSDWRRLTKSCEILHAEDAQYKIAITLPVWIDRFNIELTCEDGSQHSQMNIVADMLPCVESAAIDGQEFKRYQFELPHLAEGYHHLTVTAGDQTSQTHVIVAPPTCVNPADIAPKTWGIAVQLYSLKSANNWGLGDFSDLREFVIQAAAKGAGSIGLNPLHPLFPGNPAHRSPYSPTSRSFLNTMYIDVTAVPGYASCLEAQAIVASEEFQTLLARVRSEDFIDYGTVGYLKYKVLRVLFNDFDRDDTAQAKSFHQFRAERGEELENLACYDALYEYFRERDSHAYGWTFWPEA
ncbi:MAG: 4-alpha-glucanotransferase, partial [Pseudomonadota bacterium]